MTKIYTDSSGATSPKGIGQGFRAVAASLQFKATSVVVVLTLAVMAAVCGYLLRSSEELARTEHERQLIQTASILARAAAGPMESGDGAALRMLANRAADGSPLLYVIFSDVTGRQLAFAQQPGSDVLQQLRSDAALRVPVPGQPVFRDGTNRIPVFLDVTYPITIVSPDDGLGTPKSAAARGVLHGYVRAGMLADSWQRTMASRIDMIVGVSILAAVVAIPLGFLLVRRIVSPMDSLGVAMRRFAGGELHVRSEIRRRDELGLLAEAFNAMADEHQRTHERIVRLNAELEQRVTQRTEELRDLASRDPLTGLYNRRYFGDVLERSFSEAVRYHHELSCLMIDLDSFKHINDAFGHHVGDDVLVLTAETINGELRSSDVAARFGGDEFVILLPQTDAERARVLAERLAERFAHDAGDRIPQVGPTMSIGIASLPSAAIKHAEGLIRAADDALYSAKTAGKNCFHVAGSTPTPAA